MYDEGEHGNKGDEVEKLKKRITAAEFEKTKSIVLELSEKAKRNRKSDAPFVYATVSKKGKKVSTSEYDFNWMMESYNTLKMDFYVKLNEEVEFFVEKSVIANNLSVKMFFVYEALLSSAYLVNCAEKDTFWDRKCDMEGLIGFTKAALSSQFTKIGSVYDELVALNYASGFSEERIPVKILRLQWKERSRWTEWQIDQYKRCIEAHSSPCVYPDCVLSIVLLCFDKKRESSCDMRYANQYDVGALKKKYKITLDENRSFPKTEIPVRTSKTSERQKSVVVYSPLQTESRDAFQKKRRRFSISSFNRERRKKGPVDDDDEDLRRISSEPSYEKKKRRLSMSFALNRGKEKSGSEENEEIKTQPSIRRKRTSAGEFGKRKKRSNSFCDAFVSPPKLQQK